MIIDEAGLKQYTTMTYLYHTIAEVWVQMMRMEDDLTMTMRMT